MTKTSHYLPTANEWAPFEFGGDVARGDELRIDIGMIRVGVKRAGRTLDGRTWDEMPKQQEGIK